MVTGVAGKLSIPQCLDDCFLLGLRLDCMVFGLLWCAFHFHQTAILCHPSLALAFDLDLVAVASSLASLPHFRSEKVRWSDHAYVVIHLSYPLLSLYINLTFITRFKYMLFSIELKRRQANQASPKYAHRGEEKLESSKH